MTATRELAISLAGQALACAMRQDWQGAGALVQRIGDEVGPGGTMLAILGWCDTLADRAGLAADGSPVAITWRDQATSRIGFADDVPPRVRWAGQLISARIALDKPAFDALIGALPEDDPAAIGSYVGAVLECAALTIAGIDDGLPVGRMP